MCFYHTVALEVPHHHPEYPTPTHTPPLTAIVCEISVRNGDHDLFNGLQKNNKKRFPKQKNNNLQNALRAYESSVSSIKIQKKPGLYKT